MTYYTHATPRDLTVVGRSLREIDRIEAVHACGLSPELAVDHSAYLSAEVYAIRSAGVPVGLFGVVPQPNDTAIIWMVGTPRFYEHGKIIARAAMDLLDRWSWTYGTLFNFVSVENTRSIEWLGRLGATFHDTKPLGPLGAPFKEFNYVHRHFRRAGRRDSCCW
jgi:RimJ/RimL family protein N-acetyltransferase